ncbi:hypothetical protein [Pseudalkalibacillus sp. SCS-8]|uniref:hypothetical protein n=1 Tax=Pseudalkalibacillus nanhaiensis TaxID=3115291 RepID=UPI0032D9B815
MKKLLFIFLVGQLLLLSFIFNKSIYDIYELNNLGDSSLDGYFVEEYSGNELNALYEQLNSSCLNDESCNLQLIKTPVTSGNQFSYEIYHSQIDKIKQPRSISPDTHLSYHILTKEDFIDHNGVFYTDIPKQNLSELSREIGLSIRPYQEKINYTQIISYNALNFGLLFLLSQLVLFIYTFTRIKVNAIKKMLGFSNMKMIKSTLVDFIKMEIVIVLITLTIHFCYYLAVGNVVPRYFYLLSAFLFIVVLLNILMLLMTQISLKFIDINLMIKNKVYSNRLTYSLYAIKIVLILAITVSMSAFLSNYETYKEKQKDVEQYQKLAGYFTSNGYNYDEDERARKNLDLLEQYGHAIKTIYERYDEQDRLYVNDAYILGLLSTEYLERNGLKKEDIYQSVQDNHIVVNERYLNRFMNVKNKAGERITDLNFDQPTIFVPAQYETQEDEIKQIYIEKFNHWMNYDRYFGLSEEKRSIHDLNILYIADGQEHELLGQSSGDEADVKLKDTIIVVDQGDFSNMYYYDLLNAGDFYVQSEQREEFSQTISAHRLDKLVNVGTLLTPYMDKVYFVEFILYNSLVFSVLFLFTLIFILYISNYVDVTSNNRRYALQYIHGYESLKSFKKQIFIVVFMISGIVLSAFMEFNIVLYLSILAVDFLVLLYLYKKIIKQDLHKLVKGG